MTGWRSALILGLFASSVSFSSLYGHDLSRGDIFDRSRVSVSHNIWRFTGSLFASFLMDQFEDYKGENEGVLGRFSGQGANVYSNALASSLDLVKGTAFSSPFAPGYDDPGEAGDPASWRTVEFNADWGLGAIKADHAYARGFTGKGIKLGVVDRGVWRGHPEFSTPGKLFGLITRGIDDNGDPFIANGGMPEILDPFEIKDHGTHVGGTIAAQRDGNGMHGVAFGAELYGVQTYDFDTSARIAGFDALAAQGVSVINNSWGQKLKETLIYVRSGSQTKKKWLYTTPFVINKYISSDAERLVLYDKIEEVARSGILIVFSGGNSYASPARLYKVLPYFRPDVGGGANTERNYLSVIGIDNKTGRQSKSASSSICGKLAKLWCVAAPGYSIYSATVRGSSVRTLRPDYTTKTGTSMAAPHAAGAVGVVMERYPYMSAAQARDVMLTTADHLEYDPADFQRATNPRPIATKQVCWFGRGCTTYPVYQKSDFRIAYRIDNSIKIPNVGFGWGLINLERALDGPGQFLGDFDVTLPTNSYDIWLKDISDIAIRSHRTEIKKEYDDWLAKKLAMGWVAGIPVTASRKDKALYKFREARALMFENRQWYGSLTKRGAGILSLRGKNTFTGPTRVVEGVLDLHGQSGINSFGSLSGDVLVESAGVLQGNAKLDANLTVAGRIRPGDYVKTFNQSKLAASGKPLEIVRAIGTINVKGDYVQKSDSTYAVDIDPETKHSDQIIVGGTAKIDNGARVEVYRTQNKPFKDGSKYRIIEAKKVEGNYQKDTVSSQQKWISAFLVSSIVKDGKNIDLHIDKKRKFSEAAKTKNTKEVAKAIEKMGIKAAIAIALDNLPTDAATEAALKQLSGEVHPSIQSAMIEHSAVSRAVIQDRVRFSVGSVGARPTPTAVSLGQSNALGFAPKKKSTPKKKPSKESDPQEAPKGHLSGIEVWGQALTSWGNNTGNGNAAKTSYRNSALIVGIDKELDSGFPWRIGAMVGYGAGSLNIKTPSSSVDSRNYYLGVYSGAKWRDLGFHAGVIYGHHGLKSKRQVSFKYFSDNPKAKYSARSLQVFGGLDYNIMLSKKVSLAPFADIAYINLKTGSFKERGGLATLRATKGSTTDTTFTTLGMRGEFKLAKLPVNLRLMAGWRRAFGTTLPSVRLQLSGRDVLIAGTPIAKNAFVGGLGLDVNVTDRVKLSVDYTTQLSKTVRDHSLSAVIRISF